MVNIEISFVCKIRVVMEVIMMAVVMLVMKVWPHCCDGEELKIIIAHFDDTEGIYYDDDGDRTGGDGDDDDR